jgi:hypothetical protein
VKRAVIRLPREVVDRLDHLTEEMRVAHPDESYSRASVVRALISSGLALLASPSANGSGGTGGEGGDGGEAGEARNERLLEVARRAARTAPKRKSAP